MKKNSKVEMVELPDGTLTTRILRFDYKFCIALKMNDGPWISSWSLTEEKANKTVEMWKRSVKKLEYKIIPLE